MHWRINILFASSCLLACASGNSRPASMAATTPVQAPVVTAGELTAEPPIESLPLHEQVIAWLRRDDSVIPRRPDIHPLHTIHNREAIVPVMCYTRTEGTHNPCYVCHQDAVDGRPNRMDDGDLQRAYSFSDVGLTNHWRNLFEDRSARVAQISDAEIQAWVATDNYSALAERLRAVKFKGYIPDLRDLQLAAAAFDDEGFARDGSHWVAFNYKPLPSTFWPTNGATDDVMIRLPAVFRTTRDGVYDRNVYKANLALVEANIKGLDAISVRDVDERAFGEDLDGDGELGVITRIEKTQAYVGAAKGYFRVPHLYPLDTELLHSVRYIGVDAQGAIVVPPRMKELRYMRKHDAPTLPRLQEAYRQEGYAKQAGELPGYVDRGQAGLDNEMGWVLSGFIENRRGELRVATYEEHLFCMGCHTSVGSTFDQVFSFARKIDGADGWGYVNLRGMPDAPNRGETRGEIATYLERVAGGSELRNNLEMQARFFTNGRLDADKLAAARDVYDLITPSPARAWLLNKAYRVIVDDQDYLYGRDPTVTPPANVYDVVDPQTAPTLPAARTHRWDMRLDWSAPTAGVPAATAASVGAPSARTPNG